MKTCHGAERKTSSWAGPNWCLMKDMGPGGKRISGPSGAGGWGQADGEQLGPDTHSWRHGAVPVPSVCLGTKRITGWMLHPQHDPMGDAHGWQFWEVIGLGSSSSSVLGTYPAGLGLL